MNSSHNDVPNVLNTGQIRRHGGPVHSVHILNTEKVFDDTSPMRSGVVVLEYRVSDWHLAQKRQHMRRQNFVDVSLTVLVSVDEYKVCISRRRYTGPHHDAASLVGYPRYHCSWNMPFFAPPPDSFPASTFRI